MSGTLNWVNEWHKRACPQPDDRAFQVQLGCHFEEIAEMFDVLFVAQGDKSALNAAAMAMHTLADELKSGKTKVVVADRLEFLDSLADQVVTAVGAGYRAGMQVAEAVTEVDISNWSKFDEQGRPIFDENGKVKKGPNYRKPDLKGLT